jgi:L-fuculose-phosphate aldolase
MTTERALRAELSQISRDLHARGFCANHEANATARLAGQVDRFLATPTAVSKRLIDAEALIVVDAKGQLVSGRGRPFSELGLHLAVFAARPDVGCVIHAHPPTATGFAVAGKLLDRPLLAEAVVSLGPSIPTVPFAPPGPAAAAALGPYLAGYDAVLLEHHGVLTWGADPEQAYLRLEHVEQVARIALVAEQLGGARPLPESALPALLEARKKAFPRTATAAPPSGAPARVLATTTPTQPRSDLARIIAEEVASALRTTKS